jgi:E3 ubiquitin-protein ligase TRIP12
VPVASFASSILSSKDHPSLVLGALQLVDLLLTKVPAEYMPTFRREGVFHEIETLAIRTVASSKSKDKDKDKDVSDVPSPADSVILATQASTPGGSAAMIPGFKKLSSLSLEPDDAITLRARVIRFKHLLGNDQVDSGSAFDTLRRLVMLSEKLLNFLHLLTPPCRVLNYYKVVQLTDFSDLQPTQSEVVRFSLFHVALLSMLFQFP